jgi:hypothetical protein
VSLKRSGELKTVPGTFQFASMPNPALPLITLLVIRFDGGMYCVSLSPQ